MCTYVYYTEVSVLVRTVAVYPHSLTQLEAKGLEVLMKEERQLTKEEAAEFYKQHEGSVSAAREVWPYACMCT